MGSWFDPVFSFLDDLHFVIPSVLAERPSEIVLNVYRPLCPCSQSGQQQAPPPPPGDHPQLLRPLRLGHTHAPLLPRRRRRRRRVPGAHPGILLRGPVPTRVFRHTSVSNEEGRPCRSSLVPVRAAQRFDAVARVSTRASVRYYEPVIGRRLAYASRAAAAERSFEGTVVPMMEKAEGFRRSCVGLTLVSCVSLFAVALCSCLRCVRGGGKLRVFLCRRALLIFLGNSSTLMENLKLPRKLHILAF